MRLAPTFLPLLFAHLTAIADNADMARVEVNGAGTQQQRRQDSAGRIVVTRDELTRYGDSSMADVLRRQPGIAIVDGAVRMRGLGGGRTLILINGEPAAPGFSPDSLAPALIERIEIMRSASADASTQGIAGSINIVLRKQTARARALATLAAAHDGKAWSPDAALDLSLPSTTPSGSFSSTIAANAARTLSAFDSTFASHSATSERSTIESGGTLTERVGLAPRLNWKFDDGATLAWQSLFDLTRSDNHLQARETVLHGGASAYPRNGFGADARTVNARSDASWSQRLGEGGRFEWKAGLTHSRRDSDYLFIGSDVGAIVLRQRHVLSNALDDSVITSGKWRRGSDHGHALALGWDGTMSARSEWRRQEDADAAGRPSGLLDQRYSARVSRLALYVQDEWTPTHGLDLYVGLRWEHLRTRTDGRDLAEVSNHSSVLSPVAQVLWQLPGSRDQVRMGLARSYKAPVTRDLVPRRYTVNNDNDPTNPHFQGNADLRPELAWGLDLAYESYFGNDSMFSASTYHRRIADVVLPYLFQEDGQWTSTPRNAGRASVGGVEFELKGAIGNSGAAARATLSRNWSHVAAVPDPDNRLGEQTPLVLNAGLDYRLGAGATFGFNWNLQAASGARTSLKQWSERGIVRRLDLHGRWQIGQGLALRMTAANLLAPSAHNTLRFDDGDGGATGRNISTRSNRIIRIALEIGL